MKTTRDWAHELIAEMRAKKIDDTDEATRHFVSAYADGDSCVALEQYWAAGTVYHLKNEELVLFKDGSCYVSWSQGIDRFYPNLDMVRDQYPEECEELGLVDNS